MPRDEWAKAQQFAGFSTTPVLSRDQMEQVIELQSGVLIDAVLRAKQRRLEDYGAEEEAYLPNIGALPR